MQLIKKGILTLCLVVHLIGCNRKEKIKISTPNGVLSFYVHGNKVISDCHIEFDPYQNILYINSDEQNSEASLLLVTPALKGQHSVSINDISPSGRVSIIETDVICSILKIKDTLDTNFLNIITIDSISLDNAYVNGTFELELVAITSPPTCAASTIYKDSCRITNGQFSGSIRTLE